MGLSERETFLPKKHSFVRSVDRGSVIAASGLNDAHMAVLEGINPTRILSVDDFFAHWAAEPKLRAGGGYSLGLTNNNYMYQAVSRAMELTTWHEAYESLGLNKTRELPSNHTDIFLDKITTEGKPIVFFIPPQVMDYLEGYPTITREEMRWFLKHPQRAENVYFVFGLYDTLSKTDLNRINSIYFYGEDRLPAMAGMFREKLR